jgi:hypothetical protein
VSETFYFGDVLLMRRLSGDVLSKRLFVRGRFVSASQQEIL